MTKLPIISLSLPYLFPLTLRKRQCANASEIVRCCFSLSRGHGLVAMATRPWRSTRPSEWWSGRERTCSPSRLSTPPAASAPPPAWRGLCRHNHLTLIGEREHERGHRTTSAMASGGVDEGGAGLHRYCSDLLVGEAVAQHLGRGHEVDLPRVELHVAKHGHDMPLKPDPISIAKETTPRHPPPAPVASTPSARRQTSPPSPSLPPSATVSHKGEEEGEVSCKREWG